MHLACWPNLLWEKLKQCFDLYLVGRCENQSGSLKNNGIKSFGKIFHFSMSNSDTNIGTLVSFILKKFFLYLENFLLCLEKHSFRCGTFFYGNFRIIDTCLRTVNYSMFLKDLCCYVSHSIKKT